MGALIGCLPQSPHQNQQLGLPLRLMKEEVSLLLNKGKTTTVRQIVEYCTVYKVFLNLMMQANINYRMKNIGSQTIN